MEDMPVGPVGDGDAGWRVFTTAATLTEAEAHNWLQLDSGALVHRTAVIGLQPMASPTFARPVERHPPPVLEDGVVVGPFATIYAGAHIRAGTQVCPYAHIREGVVVGQRCVIGVAVKLGYRVVMGNDCQIMDDSHLSGGTRVGDGTFISVQVLAVNDDAPGGYKWKGVTPCRIGVGVVVGAGARLRPGISIGDGAVIAMGAVVTRDVPPGAVAKGMPARFEMPRGSGVIHVEGALDAAGAERLKAAIRDGTLAPGFP